MSDDLHSALLHFQSLVNANSRVQQLLESWERLVSVEGEDSDERYSVLFDHGEITTVRPPTPADEPDITLRAQSALLCEVFTGAKNPATEFLDGTLQVLASDRDQVKLDAISLLIWD